MAESTHPILVSRQINNDEKPWAVINLNGPFGDEIVGGFMTEEHARLFAAAPAILEAAHQVDRWSLVIQGLAHRYAPMEFAAVRDALNANRAAIAQASPSRTEGAE